MISSRFDMGMVTGMAHVDNVDTTLFIDQTLNFSLPRGFAQPLEFQLEGLVCMVPYQCCEIGGGMYCKRGDRGWLGEKGEAIITHDE